LLGLLENLGKKTIGLTDHLPCGRMSIIKTGIKFESIPSARIIGYKHTKNTSFPIKKQQCESEVITRPIECGIYKIV